MVRCISLLVVGCLVLGVAGGCGTPAGGRSANSAASGSGDPDDDGEYGEEGADGPEGEDDASRQLCTGEGCMPCGDSLCPEGFFCLIGKDDKPACTWLPACAKSADCSCLSKELSDCQCHDVSGGAEVSCP